jgi:hypothetical protein
MGRPCIGERPMTTAERMRRYRARKRGSDVRPITYRPLPAVTKTVSWAVTKPCFDPKDLRRVDTRNKLEAAPEAAVRTASGKVIDIASLIG